MANANPFETDDGTEGVGIARTTSAGVHPYSSPAASSAAVHAQQGSPPGLGEAAPEVAAGGDEVRPEDVPREQPPPKPPSSPFISARDVADFITRCLSRSPATLRLSGLLFYEDPGSDALSTLEAMVEEIVIRAAPSEADTEFATG